MPGFDKPSYGLLDEALFQSNANSIVSRYSNLGENNPNKGPSARSLFYEAAKRIPSKYGQFLFYSLGSYQNDFIDAYYRSESRDYNLAVSSLASKNPSAGFLVRETLNNEMASSNGILGGIQASYTGNIVGGLSAPYYWKDFLYCKYYGAIPNNYMITLRRFPTPVLDNLSVPSVIKSSESYHKEGVGRPVAQAVTWYGGNTSNSLNSLLKFTTGLVWDPKSQEATRTQQAFSQGFFQDGPMNFLTKALGAGSGGGADAVTGAIDAIVNASDVRSVNNNAIRAAKLRDRAKNDPNGMGLLSEYIWVPVDVIQKTLIRGTGLTFSWDSLSVVFEYELSSVGEVNTKAAMLDILGNLLSIGTNYGNFLTPDIRYDSRFAAIGFPGGAGGLEMYYKDPLGWIIQYADEISGIANYTDGTSGDAATQTVGGGTNAVESAKSKLAQLLNNGGSTAKELIDFAKQLGKDFGSGANRLFKQAVTADFIEKFQAPISLLTGAPVGEWHLTIGNPCNPVAMIGNLVCSGVSIEFSERLGPDDFPTGIKATFTLMHGRDRERGEIESIFNRGDGRLYQSNLSTSASSQSFASTADVNGQILSENTPNNFNDMSVYQNQIGAQIPR